MNCAEFYFVTEYVLGGKLLAEKEVAFVFCNRFLTLEQLFALYMEKE